ncbi:hypothetical protein TNIN_375751 [Trichonephila inaurata madagascariensis]|uniref:Uncharacterized protein n=1 Tax=Trichonephila inaurata madagascariensis TaxID=2747483 RepID=A0A8X7C0C5_9ARAC|nr:hypothetical protein TNIN_375751 [Trichonephila inaurata madagascariensis]
MQTESRIHGFILLNDNFLGWRWNYDVENVCFFWSVLFPLQAWGTPLNSTSVSQLRCRSYAIVFGYNVPLWRWSFSTGQCVSCFLAPSVSKWFEGPQSEFNPLSWPTQSPDLNNINRL